MVSARVEINDEDCLLRRINKLHVDLSRQQAGDGTWRFTSAMFKNSSQRDGDTRPTMSVNIKRLIEDAGLDPKTFMISDPYVGVASFSAGNVRKMEMEAIHDPVSNNPHHGGVFSNRRSDGRLSRAQENYLTRIANLLAGPEGCKSKGA